jgi:8-oxo-dGTP pyrophosphatase MutT (NUDIX family)
MAPPVIPPPMTVTFFRVAMNPPEPFIVRTFRAQCERRREGGRHAAEASPKETVKRSIHLSDEDHPLTVRPRLSRPVGPAARVIVLDADDRVLLFRTDIRRRPLWITPGGGLQADETAEAAARRELWEETGIEADLGPCVWVRRHVFEFGGRWLDEQEHFFVARVPSGIAVTHANWVLDDHMMSGHRWWSVDEIVASDHWFAPRRIASLLPAILSGDFPPDPIDCGV